METKFTKGEWNLVTSKESGSDVCASSGEAICQVFDATGKPVSEMDYEIMVANAKLIAAAPEMFEALKSIYDDPETFNDLFVSQQDKIKSALKKATE